MDLVKSEKLEQLKGEIPKEIYVESLNIARKICMYNSEAIYYVKNALDLMDTLIQKQLKDKQEKLTITVQMNYPSAEPELLIANPINRSNHNITLLDVDLVQENLLEGLKPKEDENIGGSLI